nr:hypothetical protein [uncultured Methanoregula sp.]
MNYSVALKNHNPGSVIGVHEWYWSTIIGTSLMSEKTLKTYPV